MNRMERVPLPTDIFGLSRRFRSTGHRAARPKGNITPDAANACAGGRFDAKWYTDLTQGSCMCSL